MGPWPPCLRSPGRRPRIPAQFPTSPLLKDAQPTLRHYGFAVMFVAVACGLTLAAVGRGTTFAIYLSRVDGREAIGDAPSYNRSLHSAD